MNVKIKALVLGIAIACLSVGAQAWTIHASFDEGEVGAVADKANDGFHGAGGQSTYSNEQKLKNNSARISIREGETGYGSWGGEFMFPERVYKGSTIWFLVHIYMPEDFDHHSYGEGNRLKFLRIQTLSATGSNHGYNDLYYDQKGAGQPYKWIYEGESRWVNVGSSENPPQKEAWQSYEMAVTLDNVPVSEGGSAKVRIWKNGLLLKEILDRKTLREADDYSNRALLFTYWNGGAPQDQHMYVDEITITVEEPVNADAHGNPHIGGLLKYRPVMAGD
ncbi:hypothetical protein [Marinimicrobium sp. ABcell2]|uniref:hypothetical protein n=1 Tax=Marinimicrobium sp. ABcell2 TaxID=3069751 RepID=UPI0027B08167|nr:hypothetical protein [Marinimicrobium sp. ABcell2]MDQ2076169.1 hypothetical protein [Marinimicrobium sp. ABcell2]